MATYRDIFVPGGFPRHTYNPRTELELESRLGEVKQNLCKLATVTGQTKSGKTVLARKVLPREDTVWIDGGTVSSEDEFWQTVVNELDLFQTKDVESGHDNSSELAASAAVEGGIIVAKGKAEIAGTLGESRHAGETARRNVTSRVVALEALATTKTPLVVDDFHYLPKELQGGLVRALKPLIFDGVPVVVIAIPHRRYDAVKVERELAGRIAPIAIPSWSDDELSFIPETGFQLLKCRMEGELSKRLATEAIGSPHLMQEFCRGICRTLGVETAHEGRNIGRDDVDVERIFREVADAIGRPIFEKLARGPRQRTDRLQRQLKSGESVDIYELVLHALAHLRPGLVSLEYEDLRSAIREVSATQIPQLQEVARVLRHMASIAATDQSSTPVIDFEEDEKKLHITDPFFAFYLRWGDLAA